MPEVQLLDLLRFYNRKPLYARSCESAIQLDPTQILEAGRGRDSPSPILGQTDLTGGEEQATFLACRKKYGFGKRGWISSTF